MIMELLAIATTVVILGIINTPMIHSVNESNDMRWLIAVILTDTNILVTLLVSMMPGALPVNFSMISGIYLFAFIVSIISIVIGILLFSTVPRYPPWRL